MTYLKDFLLKCSVVMCGAQEASVIYIPSTTNQKQLYLCYLSYQVRDFTASKKSYEGL